MAGVVVHLAPHPDDEVIGAPATLMALRDAGYRVVNVACSLGREPQRVRRRDELAEACRRAGFELVVPGTMDDRPDGRPDPPTQVELAAWMRALLDRLRPEVVVSPSPHDRHPLHESVARAVREVLSGSEHSRRWWMWGVWGELALPTLGTAFDRARLDEICHALEAHAGELARNDYRRLVAGRAAMNASRATELLYGFGRPGATTEYAELLTEVVSDGGRFLLGRPRWLDPAAPFEEPTSTDVTDWLFAESVMARFGLGGV